MAAMRGRHVAGQGAVGGGLIWCSESLLACSKMEKRNCDNDLCLAIGQVLCRTVTDVCTRLVRAYIT